MASNETPWPHAVPSLKQMLDAGFTPCNATFHRSDSVRCRECGLRLDNWESRGDPLEEHRLGSRRSDEELQNVYGDYWKQYRHERYETLPTMLRCKFLVSHPAFRPALNTYVFDPEGDVRLILQKEETRTTSPTSNDPADLQNETAEEQHIPISTGKSIDEEPIMLVSSRHLMLASPMFKAMLQPRFAEGLALQKDGQVDIPLFDDDCAALEILLNIIHCRPRKVPKSINLKMLTVFLVLVDKYQTHEAVENYTNIWFENLKSNMPDSVTAELYPWICICWVLQKKEEFRELTRIAQLECTRRIDKEFDEKHCCVPGDLPVPAAVIDEIEKTRSSVVRGILRVLRVKLMPYIPRGKKVCIQRSIAYLKEGTCDSLVLGVLTKFLLDMGLSPLLAEDELHSYSGRFKSVKGTSNSIERLEIPSMCFEIRRAKNSHTMAKRCHDLKDEIMAMIEEQEARCTGLLYDDFCRGEKA